MSFEFDLSGVFHAVAAAIPDSCFLHWRGEQFTYAATDIRVDGVAHYLHSLGVGCHTERRGLQGYESGQDHLGIYLRNSNQYLETMLGAYRARVAPFNVNFRYTGEELIYLLRDARATVLVYGAEFAPRVAEIRDRLPEVKFLIQVPDDSGHPLLEGAVDFETIVHTAPPSTAMPVPSGEDLFIIYTGGTTGMPKGVLWRQHDIFMSSMGGRPLGGGPALDSLAALQARVRQAPGALSLLMVAPFMHGAGQWATFYLMTMGGWIALPDDVRTLDSPVALRLVERLGITGIPVVGDAVARPLIDEIETGRYDLRTLLTITNGGAPLSPTVRDRILAALPHVALFDVIGSSETGTQMNRLSTAEVAEATGFSPSDATAVISPDRDRVLAPGDGQGWLAQRGFIPLGYLGDPAKTSATYPTIDGVRWSLPGDRADYRSDGIIVLLGRDSLTINTGGEKVFVEEVERALCAHDAVYDVVVVGRPCPRWGEEVVAIVKLIDGVEATDQELAATCAERLARYKVPKSFIRTSAIVRSPAGKADYRWARELAIRTSGQLPEPTPSEIA